MRPIDADALLEKMQRTSRYFSVVYDVDAMPTLGVAPVVHGAWESIDSSYWRCTPSGAVPVSCVTYRCCFCGRGTVVKTNYCPNCGAKMDGGDKDD